VWLGAAAEYHHGMRLRPSGLLNSRSCLSEAAALLLHCLNRTESLVSGYERPCGNATTTNGHHGDLNGAIGLWIKLQKK
jgi:hypothetical protein